MPAATARDVDRPVTLDPADVGTHLDQFNRLVVTVPDDVARAMIARIKCGWTEFHGMADGVSRKFEEGHWLFAVTEVILAAVAAMLEPEGLDDLHLEYLRRDQRWARLGMFHGFIVGRSHFDPDTGWWTSNSTDLSVGTTPQIYQPTAGRRYVEYGG